MSERRNGQVGQERGKVPAGGQGWQWLRPGRVGEFRNFSFLNLQ